MDKLVFNSKEEALDWLSDQFEPWDCMDNQRFAFYDDLEAVAKYSKQEQQGCCGFRDLEVVVDGRNALLGCNYGH